MARTPNNTTFAATPGGQTALPQSQHFGPGVQTVPGTSVLQINNLNKGQANRTVSRNAAASTNARTIARPQIPSAYR